MNEIHVELILLHQKPADLDLHCVFKRGYRIYKNEKDIGLY